MIESDALCNAYVEHARFCQARMYHAGGQTRDVRASQIATTQPSWVPAGAPITNPNRDKRKQPSVNFLSF